MNKRQTANRLQKMYKTLLSNLGPQSWWPAESPFEVCIGAILTQNTAWKNVERAITNLKSKKALSCKKIAEMDQKKLAELIRPSGYFNQKSERLKLFCRFLLDEYHGDTKLLFQDGLEKVRPILLDLKGVGPETADSMLLYAGDLPIFVVDTYTRRIFARHDLIPANADYENMQRLFMDHLPMDAGLFNEYHALIVRIGNTLCKKSNPLCDQCPIQGL